jgi:putative transposase
MYCNSIGAKLVRDGELFSRHGTNPAVVSLHQLGEKHNLSGTVFIIDGFRY